MRSVFCVLLLVLVFISSSCSKPENKNSAIGDFEEYSTTSGKFNSPTKNQAPKTFTTFGNPSCGQWVAAFEKEKSNDLSWTMLNKQSWLVGYMSGINSSEYLNVDILKNTDADSIYLFVDNYCREHPLDDVTDAAMALYSELLIKSSN